tara:strand:- start:3115 stop:4026 length:912 start_codon:yes stop_codon:yes gene_type:complete
MFSQDVHFSQFNQTKSLINPALIGFQDGDYKLQLQRRSQWQSVSVPFNTFSISLEAKNIFKNCSFGVQLLDDIAGDSHFKTNGITSSISYKLKVNNRNNISCGILFGAYQRSIDYSNLVFNDVENIPNKTIDFFDVAIGGAYEHDFNSSMTIISGLSLFHLNKPNQTLLGSKNIELPINSKIHASVIYYFNSKLQIKPTLYYSEQDGFNEFISGIRVNYLRNKPSSEAIVLRAGLFNRKNDAIIPEFGIKIDNFDAMVSYDINISSLNAASDYKGGFEVSLAYEWSISKLIKKTEINICPKYL